MTDEDQIPEDNIMDVLEMTYKLQTYMSHVLRDNQLDLALSSLMNASINTMILRCSSLDELVSYRNLFVQMLDDSIRSIQTESLENPPSYS